MWRCDFGPVAAEPFRGVQSNISLDHQASEIAILALPNPGNTDTRRHANLAALKRKSMNFQLLPQPFHRGSNAVLIGERHDKEKLVSADAPADIALPAVPPNDFGYASQDDIAGFMSERVVHRFELVDINHHDPEREPVSERAGQLPPAPLFDRAPIRKVGQTVGESELLQNQVFCLDFPVQFHDPAARIHSRRKFLRVERFCHVVIGSRLQPFHHLALFGDAREHDDVGKPSAEINPNSFTQLQPAQIRH